MYLNPKSIKGFMYVDIESLMKGSIRVTNFAKIAIISVICN